MFFRLHCLPSQLNFSCRAVLLFEMQPPPFNPVPSPFWKKQDCQTKWVTTWLGGAYTGGGAIGAQPLPGGVRYNFPKVFFPSENFPSGNFPMVRLFWNNNGCKLYGQFPNVSISLILDIINPAWNNDFVKIAIFSCFR